MARISHDAATELAARRTGMSFQRTRMAAERTLMAVVRTSLSMISFGFTIYQLAERLKEQGVIPSDGRERQFGSGLIIVGIVILAMGIIYHLRFMLELRRKRAEMAGDQLVYAETGFPPSVTVIAAGLLLVVGSVTMVTLLF